MNDFFKNQQTIFYPHLIQEHLDVRTICDETITRIIDIRGYIFHKMDKTVWKRFYTKEQFIFTDYITNHKYLVYPAMNLVELIE